MALRLIGFEMGNNSLIAQALHAPYQQILANAPKDFMIEDHIQDPLKVVRTAFEKASSIARSLSTTEVLTAWQEEKPRFVQEAEQQDEPED